MASVNSVHHFNLKSEQLIELKNNTMQQVSQEVSVVRLTDDLRKVDEKTWEHSWRVAELMVGGAILFDMPPKALQLAVRGGLLHDCGKDHEEVQGHIHSGKRYLNGVSAVIQRHVEYGVKKAQATGVDQNTCQIIGNHHAYQDRPYYVYKTVQGVPDKDGFVPNMGRLVELAAACDVVDAFYQLSVGERTYGSNDRAHYDWASAVKAVGSLVIDDAVKQVVIDLTDPRGVMTQSAAVALPNY